MKKTAHILLILVAVPIVVGIGGILLRRISSAATSPLPAPQTVPTTEAEPQSETVVAPPVTDQPELPAPQFIAPISRGLERVTKKPFGLHITPETSPVEHDRFSGYHVGVDFETFPDEQDAAIDITAACDGILLLKKQASGYGGVAVQSCTLDDQPVTVVYGHLDLASIAPETGASLHQGDFIGVLGKGYSPETDGVRKHLHLGIHAGPDLNILGYVQEEEKVSGWLDALQYLR